VGWKVLHNIHNPRTYITFKNRPNSSSNSSLQDMRSCQMPLPLNNNKKLPCWTWTLSSNEFSVVVLSYWSLLCFVWKLLLLIKIAAHSFHPSQGLTLSYLFMLLLVMGLVFILHILLHCFYHSTLIFAHILLYLRSVYLFLFTHTDCW